MTVEQTRVAIVLLADFGAHLRELAERCHVWVVDTPANRLAAEAVRASGPSDRTHGVTTFKTCEGESIESSLIDLLPVIDEHHGLRGEWATDVVLEIRGAALTAALRSELDELGSFDICEDAGGFVATRQSIPPRANRIPSP
jgi:hypothetical protein